MTLCCENKSTHDIEPGDIVVLYGNYELVLKTGSNEQMSHSRHFLFFGSDGKIYAHFLSKYLNYPVLKQ